jgi:hypothetical protein
VYGVSPSLISIESVISRLRNRTAIEPANAQDHSGELPERLLTWFEIGVTNRIRTGTNAFTGRDAAVTS